jgi:hypothetical protein
MDVSEPRLGGVFDASREEHIRAAQNQTAEFPLDELLAAHASGRAVSSLRHRRWPKSAKPNAKKAPGQHLPLRDDAQVGVTSTESFVPKALEGAGLKFG